MKKAFLLFLTLSLFTACENEPLDSDFTGIDNPTGGGGTGGGGTGGSGGGNNNDTFTLSTYAYDKSINTGLDISTLDTDFIINSSGKISAQSTVFDFLGITISANAPVIRDTPGRIIGTSVISDGTTLNTTTIDYNENGISKITFTDNENTTGDDDYIYNFSYNGNVVTRTEEGTTDSVIYTFNSDDKLSQRETLENGTSVRIENISYDGNNNLLSSVITGQNATTFTYTYDSNTNPLKNLFDDFFKYQLFNDNYDDQFEHWLAILSSTNNLLSATTPEGPSNLTVQYDSNNRITSRSGNINSALLNAGSGDITINEVFEYAN